MLECFTCFKAFDSKQELKSHLRDTDHGFECTQCLSAPYLNGADLYRLHTQEFHVPITCRICSETVYGSHNLALHRKTHHKTYRCSLKVERGADTQIISCTGEFLSEKALQMHIADVHVHSCQFCSQVRNSRQKLHFHYIFDHFFCVECLQQFDTTQQLQQHFVDKLQQRQHTSPPSSELPIYMIDCTLCYKQSVPLADLVFHMAERHHHCMKCNRTYPNYSDLVTHDYEYHEGELLLSDYIIQCTICSTPLRKLDPTAILDHYHSHNHCLECNIQFSSRESLNAHLKLHSSKKRVSVKRGDAKRARRKKQSVPVTCEVCFEKVPSSGPITHMALKHWICHPCDLSFHSEKSIATHSQSEHGGQLFKVTRTCKICFQKVETAHISKHNASHRYCSVCNKQFGDWQQYKAHMLNTSIHKRKPVNPRIKPLS